MNSAGRNMSGAEATGGVGTGQPTAAPLPFLSSACPYSLSKKDEFYSPSWLQSRKKKNPKRVSIEFFFQNIFSTNKFRTQTSQTLNRQPFVLGYHQVAPAVQKQGLENPASGPLGQPELLINNSRHRYSFHMTCAWSCKTMYLYQGLGKGSGNVYNLRGKYGNKEKSHDTLEKLLQILMSKIWFMLQQIISVLNV